MIVTLREDSSAPAQAPSPFQGLSELLPKRARPSWVAQIGEPSRRPPAPSPVVARAQMRDKTRRARRSLRQRGVRGFMAALSAVPRVDHPLSPVER